MSDLSHINFSPVRQLASPRKAARRPLLLAGRYADAVEIDAFSAWVLRRGGLADTCVYRAGALHRRIPACLRALRVSSTEEARALLEERPELLRTALNALLIGVTSFFRDRHVFDEVRNNVLPRLIGERGGVRVLAAGCSCGQELYSVAMLAGEMGALETSSFLGIDCRADAIAEARAGVFSASALSSVDAAIMEKYFIPRGSALEASAEIRSRIRWLKADLMRFDPRGPWDLILFRNVVIYMLPQAASHLWSALSDALCVGGVLVTGKSERPTSPRPLVRLGHCLYQKN